MAAIPFRGNAKYCYANATSMLLATIHEKISPELIEVLTGVGLGAARFPGAPFFFSMFAPDRGITQALQMLGFAVDERICEKAPIEELRTALAQGPCLLGPVDMGHLVYIPMHRELAGADHYVLAYEMTDDAVLLHDPDGYPYVTLSLQNLDNAWKADRVGYRREPYRMWAQPQRKQEVRGEDLYTEAIRAFKRIYRDMEEAAPHIPTEFGSQTIQNLAQLIRANKVTRNDIENLKYFSLALGAKRSIDYATFFAPYNEKLAAEKDRQARLFGLCHSHVVAQNWSQVAAQLEQLAESETSFREHLLAI